MAQAYKFLADLATIIVQYILSGHISVTNGIILFAFSQIAFYVCACSSVDRASVFGTEGRGFESLRAYHFSDAK